MKDEISGFLTCLKIAKLEFKVTVHYKFYYSLWTKITQLCCDPLFHSFSSGHCSSVFTQTLIVKKNGTDFTVIVKIAPWAFQISRQTCYVSDTENSQTSTINHPFYRAKKLKWKTYTLLPHKMFDTMLWRNGRSVDVDRITFPVLGRPYWVYRWFRLKKKRKFEYKTDFVNQSHQT